MDATTWNGLIAALSDPHVLQTWEWGQVKADFGWQPLFAVWPAMGEMALCEAASRGGHPPREADISLPPAGNFHLAGNPPRAAALILQRSLLVKGFAKSLRVMYVPKGPLLSDWGNGDLRQRVLRDLQTLAVRRGAIFIKIDPDVRLGEGIPGAPDAEVDPLGPRVTAELQAHGWRFSAEQIQFRNTVLLDLTAPEDELLARMKQKTRYNIRLAARRGVAVRSGGLADLGLLYRMYAETSERDGFVIRDEGYYRQVWQTFLARPEQSAESPLSVSPAAAPLIAEVEGEPVAAVVIFCFGGKAWFLYGMSRAAHRERMPNYLLQWEAMRWAKAAGCKVYDLWGAPDAFVEDDPLWGVYRFKEGLGGQVVRTIGAWDRSLRPLYYRLYTQIIPRFLEIMRSRGWSRTRRAIE